MSARKPKPVGERESEVRAALAALIADADADHWTEEGSEHRVVTVANVERGRAALAKAGAR